MLVMTKESKTLYDVIGGEARVREMVDRFYDLMDLEPEFQLLRSVHGPSLENANQRLFMLTYICLKIIGDIRHPERDVVRAEGDDDPLAGPIEGLEDKFVLGRKDIAKA